MTENVIVVSVCSLALFVPNGAWPVKAPDLDGGTATRSHCRAGNALGAIVFPAHAGLLCPPAGGTPRGAETAPGAPLYVFPINPQGGKVGPLLGPATAPFGYLPPSHLMKNKK